MRLIDQQYLETPFYGSRKMTVFLQSQGYQVNRKRVQRLMREMGLFVIYPRPNTSKAQPAHQVYPYLLRGLPISSANQVWCTEPEIFNSDQGAQFTATAFINCLKAAKVNISMDGRGRCHDNIFIERLWRSLKLIYLKSFENGQHLTREVKQWFHWYNQIKPHQGLEYKTPNQVYCDNLKDVNVKS
ncbi:IS3 family transposase [Cyanobacteria bacterium FACHB-63]|nr:IS3 family transposase [Cyanobacteria bacterium FACHB-63]